MLLLFIGVLVSAIAVSYSAHWNRQLLNTLYGELSVRDEPFDTDLKLRVDSIPVDTAGETTRLLGQGSGRYKGHEFNLEGRADSPTVLFVSGDENYDVDFKARAGATRARVRRRRR